MNNINRLAKLFNGWLAEYEPAGDLLPRLNQTSQSALIAGGKRFRPVLCLTVGEVLGVSPAELRSYTLALEMIHAASLVHDDLPGLDNSDERRGHPSAHKEFGEAAAILAGDLLIGEAFRILGSAEEQSYEVRCKWIVELASANAKICSGQLRELDNANSELVMREKTAALIRASVMGAPILLGSRLEPEKSAFWSTFGENLGLLFQLRDDQLDGESGREDQGKGERLFGELCKAIETNYPIGKCSAAGQLNELVKFVWERGS